MPVVKISVIFYMECGGSMMNAGVETANQLEANQLAASKLEVLVTQLLTGWRISDLELDQISLNLANDSR